MAFSADQLNDEEQAILDLRPHWWFFAPQIAALIVALAIGVVALLVGNTPFSIAAAVLLGLVLTWFIVRYVVWSTTHFVVTTDRLITRDGVFSRSGIEIPLERVNTVFFEQNIFERIIGSGDLAIESAGEQGSQQFSNIRKPLNVQNEIHRQMESNENRKFDRVGRDVASEASIPEQIGQLDELRQRGILTEAEFQTKKAELLNRM